MLAEIKAEQQLLDAELREFEHLQEVLEQLNENRKDARLAHERAKIEREEANGAIERLKYTALLKHFPTMDDTTRLVMSRIMSDGRCLVCNASAKKKRLELNQHLARGSCPICGAEPEAPDNVTAPHEFNQAMLDREQARAKQAKHEEETKFQQLQDFVSRYDQTLKRLTHTRQSIEERRNKDHRLRAKLPEDTTSREYENTLKTLRSEHRKWQGLCANYQQELRALLADKKETITEKANELKQTFSELIHTLLVEGVRLVQVSAKPRYMQAAGQAQDRIEVPAYAAEMTSAARPGFIRRRDQSEVSESQRELIDLAFRLALVGVFGGPCTFVMETPEASLDGLAMERVGRALAAFSKKDDNCLVVTSNLSNTGIITALFADSTPEEQMDARLERVLNLLQIAAPNGALLEYRQGYDKLLIEAVSGSA